MTLNKGQTALLLSLLHQQDDEVSRFLFAAPFISNEDYDEIESDVDTWIAASNTGNLYGTNEDNSTFQFDGIGSDPIFPR